MEVDEGNKFLHSALTDEEWSQVPVDVGKKLEAFAEEKFEELLTSKALYETKRTETGKNNIEISILRIYLSPNKEICVNEEHETWL